MGPVKTTWESKMGPEKTTQESKRGPVKTIESGRWWGSWGCSVGTGCAYHQHTSYILWLPFHILLLYIIYHIYAFLKTTQESKMGRVKTMEAVWELGVHTILTPKSTQKPPDSWRWAQWKPPEMGRQLRQCGNWVCIPPTYQLRPSTTPPLPSLSAMQSLICILHCRARVGTVSSKNLVALFMLSLRSCLCPMDWTLSIYMGGKFNRVLCVCVFSVSCALFCSWIHCCVWIWKCCCILIFYFYNLQLCICVSVCLCICVSVCEFLQQCVWVSRVVPLLFRETLVSVC